MPYFILNGNADFYGHTFKWPILYFPCEFRPETYTNRGFRTCSSRIQSHCRIACRIRVVYDMEPMVTMASINKINLIDKLTCIISNSLAAGYNKRLSFKNFTSKAAVTMLATAT